MAEFLAPVRVQFARRKGPAASERYCTGLLTEHPNKNCDTLARLVPGTSGQRLQGLEKLVGYAHRRHWVGQYYEEAKGLLGWDQYQGRLWAGFRRLAVTVMLAYSFLVWQEWRLRWTRPRPGRPRPAFSPSPGPPAGVAPGGPPATQRLATGGSHPGVDEARRQSQLVPALRK